MTETTASSSSAAPSAVPSAVRRIFLSSTFVDLQTHRAAVRDIIGRLGQFTLAMEQFGARDGDPQTVATDLVSGCDLYLGLVAWRYGSVPAGQGRSVTHLEYDEAGWFGIPRLLFLAAAETQGAADPTDLFPASARDPDYLAQLLAFRAQIEREQVVDYFTSPDDLAKKVATALHQYLQSHPSTPTLPPPHNLPPRVPGFIGREADLQAVAAGLKQGHVMAVVGMGGLGKTSLAAEVAHALAAEPDAFPGGVTWVRCDRRSGPDGAIWILDQLLAAWNASLPAEVTARVTSPEDGLELRERALRRRLGLASGESRLAPSLVLLDNVEPALHLGRLLDTLEPLGIVPLLTTRVEPSTPRVRLLRLDALDAPSGIRLFAERFTARGGTWGTARDEQATQQIVEALGGLPLAIELAAARAARTHLTLPTLTEEMRAPDALARLNDPVDLSAGVRYSLSKTLLALTPTERLRFGALGLPEGQDWPPLVIEGMFAGILVGQEDVPTPQADLEALVSYSLVSPVTSLGEDAPRFHLHPLVRDLAHEEFTQQATSVREAALAGLLAGAQSWVDEHRMDFATLGRDDDLIAGTLRAAAKERVEPQRLIATIKALDVYVANGNLTRREELVGLQLASARAIGDRKSELIALHRLAGTYALLAWHDKQYSAAREAVEVARAVGDPKELASALGAAAGAATETGRVDEARTLYDEGRRIGSALQAGPGMAGTFSNLADAAARLGDLQEAARLFAQALASARLGGVHPVTLTVLLANYGEVCSLLGDDGAAREHLEEAVVLLRGSQSLGEALAQHFLGEVLLKTGDVESAARLFQEALQTVEQRYTDLPDAEGGLLITHLRGNVAATEGEAARLRGDNTEARRRLEEALGLFEGAEVFSLHYTRAYEDFVRQRLAEAHKQPGASAAVETSAPHSETAVPPTPESIASSRSTGRGKRRWWPWGR
jgi:tetratricopeptide (TPR) repeat protein